MKKMMMMMTVLVHMHSASMMEDKILLLPWELILPKYSSITLSVLVQNNIVVFFLLENTRMQQKYRHFSMNVPTFWGLYLCS